MYDSVMNDQQPETTAAPPDLSSLVIPLLKGVIYRGEVSKSPAIDENDFHSGLQLADRPRTMPQKRLNCYLAEWRDIAGKVS